MTQLTRAHLADLGPDVAVPAYDPAEVFVGNHYIRWRSQRAAFRRR